MTTEEKILERLDELSQEIKDIKQSVQPYLELKEEMGPIVNELVAESIHKLDGLGKDFDIENMADLMGEFLASSKNLTEALRSLNDFMEIKREFSPFVKEIVDETVKFLDVPGQTINIEDMQYLFKSLMMNTKQLSEAMHMFNSMMELQKDVSELTKPIVDTIIEHLSELQSKGVFEGIEKGLAFFENILANFNNINLDEAKPVKGVFGMMSALKDPEVQRGLGVMMELSKVFSMNGSSAK